MSIPGQGHAASQTRQVFLVLLSQQKYGETLVLQKKTQNRLAEGRTKN